MKRKPAKDYQKMLLIPVSEEEIKKFEPMIHRIFSKEILRYWNFSNPELKRGAMINRMAYDFDDLMQFGRELVVKQIRWYKLHGDPRKASLSTLMYQYLTNKFIVLSKFFTTNSRGGHVNSQNENYVEIRRFLDNFDFNRSFSENKKNFCFLLKRCEYKSKKNCSIRTGIGRIKDNQRLYKKISDFLYKTQAKQTFSYDDLEHALIDNNLMNPEESVLFKEELLRRFSEEDSKIE